MENFYGILYKNNVSHRSDRTLLFGFLRQGLLCSPGWARTHCLDQVILQFTDPPALFILLSAGLKGVCYHTQPNLTCILNTVHDQR